MKNYAALLLGCVLTWVGLPASAAPKAWVAQSGASEVWIVPSALVSRDTVPPTEVVSALNGSVEAWFETPEGGNPNEVARFVEQHGASADYDLFAALADTDAARLESVLAANGIDDTNFRHAKPWWAYLQLNSLHGRLLRERSATLLESGLKERIDRSKTAVRSEFSSTSELLTWFAGLPDDAQLCALRWQIGRIQNLDTETREAVQAWSEGHDAYYDEFGEDLRRRCPTVHHAMVVERNARWVPRIREMLRQPGRHIVVVGSAHLTSDRQGLPALLQASGITLTRR